MATPLAFEPHNHAECVADALITAERRCRETGARLTPQRRRVLEILLESHRALGAYELLSRLADEGRAVQPTIVYRALDFLVAQGLVHKIARLSAFVACTRPKSGHGPAFLVCRACRGVAEAELDAVQGALDMLAKESGFALELMVLEAEGLCPGCRPAA
ncbi:MAG: Fur family transcriptional regulator [Pseudomonadota bacterium]